MATQRLTRYPILQETIAKVIQYILNGQICNEPVHIGIDNYPFVRDCPKYERLPSSYWQNHMASYSVVEVSIAVSSIWLQLKSDRTSSIFSTGTYFYNSESGSFELEITAEGKVSQIMAEFNCRTPGFIPQLFRDFPDQAYPNKDELKKGLSSCDPVDDELFIHRLRPAPFKFIEID